jgi:hypothetical protein
MGRALPVNHYGTDHASLALLPFGIADDSRRFQTVTVAYQATVDGRLRRVNVVLDPGTSVGLPTPGDHTVFLALLQLAASKGSGQRIEFRLIDLIAKLGWTKCGRNYDRLRESLERLVGLTITLNSAFVSRTGNEYHRQSKAAHIVEAYQINTQPDQTCWVEWGHIVQEAFRLGDLKRLDWDLVRLLGNPIALQLYRLIDRVVLSGESRWEIEWKPLAQALGMSVGYDRPAAFHRKIRAHLESLVSYQIIESYEYGRGGRFIFHVRNYLRGQLRRILTTLGVFPDVARQLVAGYDEMRIIAQLDCLQHGGRPQPNAVGGFLTEAIRQGYPLNYPADEAETFVKLGELYSAEERRTYHRAGLWICGLGEDLFANHDDPALWPLELRAAVRFLMCHGLEPEAIYDPSAAAALTAAPVE